MNRPKLASNRAASIVLALALAASAPAAAQGPTPCVPTWVPEFGGQVGANDQVRASALFDDGGGTALYIGGAFTAVGGAEANRIARWDGSAWSRCDAGLDGPASAFAVFDDGSGPALFVGGEFTTAGGQASKNVAKWDGASWTAIPGWPGGPVGALAAFDDGSGPALYVGGNAASSLWDGVMRWDGTAWTQVGSSWQMVHALAVCDFGSGPELIATGKLNTGIDFGFRVARWNGSTWTPIGATFTGEVYTAAVFDDGGGPALYAGGSFVPVGGLGPKRLARWDGSTWSSVGDGVWTYGPVWPSGMGEFGLVTDLVVHDDGSGPALFVGGIFENAGPISTGIQVNNVARWNGSSWAALASGLGSIGTLLPFDLGGGPALFAGGNFPDLYGGKELNHMARWDGIRWSPFGNGLGDTVRAVAAFDDGSGPALYAGGEFHSAGGKVVNHIARWSGSSWSPLAVGAAAFDAASSVQALGVFDAGSGPELYVGGQIYIGGQHKAIVKWDGSSWTVPGGATDGGGVRAFVVHDDGSGPALYVGGSFLTMGGVPGTRGIARWDGASWSSVGGGVGTPSFVGPSVNALEVFDDGSGPALYAGGYFASAGGALASNVARWNGSAWSSPGLGISGVSGPWLAVDALAAFDDGSGSALYAGGYFTSAGGTAVSSIARWNGASWSAVGGGLGGGIGSAAIVGALEVFDDGGGPALYAAGNFASAGGVPATCIARWKGAGWSALSAGPAGGPELDGAVLALSVFDDGSGPALILGGEFALSPAGDSFLARWGCAIAGIPGCAGNPATLAALAASAPLGATLPLRITGGSATNGLGLVLYGAPGVDAAGCGLVVPGIGEVLLSLAPAPALVATGALVGGTSDLGVLVPGAPALSGVTAHLQGAAVDVGQPQPIELTNALAVVLGP